jgi:toxin ParE1/3/4
VTRATLKPLVRRARADTDVEGAIDHYHTESAAVALGFVDALETVYEQIRRAPAAGSPRYAHELNIPGLRFWPCSRYPYLVFYLDRRDRIEVWRVMHASRDIPQWLQDEGAG